MKRLWKICVRALYNGLKTDLDTKNQKRKNDGIRTTVTREKK